MIFVIFWCPDSESLPRCVEDSIICVSVEVRAHCSPLTVHAEEARHLLSRVFYLQGLDMWIWAWPIRCTALDSEPETTEEMPQRTFSGGGGSCGYHAQIPGHQQQHCDHSGLSPGCGTAFPGL